MLTLKHRMYLQAFAEGFESAGDTGGIEGSTMDSGLANQTDADEDDELFGYEQEDASTVSPGVNEADDGDDYQKFREKYKDRIGEEIQGAIQKRFKNQQSYEDSYNDLLDGLAPLFLKYGLQGSDIDGLKNALATDDSLLEEMAYDEGLTTEALREKLQQRQENAKLQKELDRMKEEEARRQASIDARNDYNRLLEEALELQQLYPNFDLTKELENDEFREDALHSGKPLRKVYEAAHLDEILQGAVQTTAQKVRESVTNNIRARGMRPAENGTKIGSVSVKKNVNDLTDKDIDRIIARARAGEIIKF